MKAIKNCVPIKKEEIKPTLQNFATTANIDFDLLYNNLLGSAEKTETSNDIDIALSEKFMKNFKNWHQCKKNFGFKVFSLPYPIASRPKDFCQIDLFFGDEEEWLKFFFFSAGNKSKYKGVYRTCLLRAIAASHVWYEVFDNNLLIAKDGLILDKNNLRSDYRIRRKKKNGEYKQKMSSCTEQEFFEIYPNVTKQHELINIKNVLKAKKLLGISKTDKFEDLLVEIQNKNVKKIEKIYQEFTGYTFNQTPRR